MSKAKVGRAAAACLAMLMAATAVVEAQRTKPGVPGRTGAPSQQGAVGQAATSGQSGPQVTAAATQKFSGLLPCCVLERVESSLKQGTSLVVKNTKSGELHRIRVGSGPGKLSSAAKSKYRPGQVVAMNLDRTAFAITPFPVVENKSKKINGNSSWKMWTDVTVSKDGRLDGKTRTKSSEAMRGFTGGVEVVLTDRAGNILHQTQLRKYGVNGTAMGGKSDRTENWNETVPAAALNQVSAVVIHHSYEPKVRLAAGVSWIKDNWKLVHKVYKCGKELYDVATAEPEGQRPAPPPPPAPGQPTTQPPADNSVMECLEATSDLAKELGY